MADKIETGHWVSCEVCLEPLGQLTHATDVGPHGIGARIGRVGVVAEVVEVKNVVSPPEQVRDLVESSVVGGTAVTSHDKGNPATALADGGRYPASILLVVSRTATCLVLVSGEPPISRLDEATVC